VDLEAAANSTKANCHFEHAIFPRQFEEPKLREIRSFRGRSMTTAIKAPSGDRNTVLATLGDYIREVSNPDDLAFAAAELLGSSLNVSRAGWYM
jgi:hypothetical protein